MNTRIPSFGLGTFRLKGQTVIDSVRQGLELGYRHIDTAQIYGNEAEVGQAIEDSRVPRSELFVTTKIWTENLSADKLVPSLRDSVRKLRMDHVDLTLIHWPSPSGAVPLADSLHALQAAQQQGLTGLVGVSNFTVDLLRQAIGVVGANAIATNQVELHAYLQSPALVTFAREQGIHLTSYMTLAYGKVLGDPVINAIAQARGWTPAQVALAWALQRGFAVIPSSTKRENLQGNLKAPALKLSEGEMDRINALDRNERLVDPEGLAPAWD